MNQRIRLAKKRSMKDPELRELWEGSRGFERHFMCVVVLTKRVTIPSYPRPFPVGTKAFRLRRWRNGVGATLLFKGLLFATVPFAYFRKFSEI